MELNKTKFGDVKVSVIIPVFNVEKYVRECLDSVIHQTTDNMEIIIIDDGSTDNSGQICKEYAQAYAVVKYIRQENTGLGGARNTGLLQAHGEYILFLDSDDKWREDCILQIQKCLMQYPCLDIVYFDAEVFYESELIPRNDDYDKKIYDRKGKIREDICTGAEFFDEIYPLHFNVSACMAAYRREFLLNHKIYFPSGVLYEDNLFSLQAILKARAIKYLPYNLYIRRYRFGSIMTSKKNKEYVQSTAKVFTLVLEYVESERGQYEEIVFRKLRDMGFALAHRCLQEFRNYIGKQSEIRQIKEEVCEKIYGLMGKRGKDELWLEEWVILILAVLYIKSDIDMESYAKQLLKMEGVSSMDEMLFQYKCQYRKKVEEKLRSLPLWKSYERIGIYGKGNHTKQLLHMLKQIEGLPAGLFIIDSSTASGMQEFEGLPVVNIRDVPNDTEFVLISSFLYEQELYDTAIRYLSGHIHVERMYQNEVREICWEWLCDVE